MVTICKTRYGTEAVKALVYMIDELKQSDKLSTVTVVVDSNSKALYLRHNLIDTLASISDSGLSGLINVQFTSFRNFYRTVSKLDQSVASPLFLDGIIWGCLDSDNSSYFYGFKDSLLTRQKLAELLIKFDESVQFKSFFVLEKNWGIKTQSLVKLYQSVVEKLNEFNLTMSDYSTTHLNSDNEVGQLQFDSPVVFYLPELLSYTEQHRLKLIVSTLEKSSPVNLLFGVSEKVNLNNFIQDSLIDPIINLESLKGAIIYNGSVSKNIIGDNLGTHESYNPNFNFILTSDIAAEVEILNTKISDEILERTALSDISVLVPETSYGNSIVGKLGRSGINCNGYTGSMLEQSYIGLLFSKIIKIWTSGFSIFELWDLFSVLSEKTLRKFLNMNSSEVERFKSELLATVKLNPGTNFGEIKGLSSIFELLADYSNKATWKEVATYLGIVRDNFILDANEEFIQNSAVESEALYKFNNQLKELEFLENTLLPVNQDFIVQAVSVMLSSYWGNLPVVGSGISINNLFGSAGILTGSLYVMGLVEGKLPVSHLDEVALPKELFDLFENETFKEELKEMILFESSIRSARKVTFLCPLSDLVSAKENIISKFFLSYLAEKDYSENQVVVKSLDQALTTSNLNALIGEKFLNRYESYFKIVSNNLNSTLNEFDAAKSYFVSKVGLNTYKYDRSLKAETENHIDIISFARSSSTDDLAFQTQNRATDSTELKGRFNLADNFNLTTNANQTNKVKYGDGSDYSRKPAEDSLLFHLNAYAIMCYLECPKKYFYEYKLKASYSPKLLINAPFTPKDLGTALHTALKHFNQKLAVIVENYNDSQPSSKALERLIDSVLEIFKEEYSAFALSEVDLANLEEKSELLRNFLRGEIEELNSTLNDLKEIAPEKSISTIDKISISENIPALEVEFKGQADKVEYRNNAIKVIDYKSGKYKSIRSNKQYSDFSKTWYLKHFKEFQNAFYSWIILHSFPEPKPSIEFSYVYPFEAKNSAVYTKLDDQHFKTVDEIVKAVATGIFINEFPENPSDDCVYCEFSNICKQKDSKFANAKYLQSNVGKLLD